jgi:histidine ammonia-lyase
MHSAVTAAEAIECLRYATATVLLAAAQAVDLRGGPARLGQGSRRIYDGVRQVAALLESDRPMEDDIAALAEEISWGGQSWRARLQARLPTPHRASPGPRWHS